MSLVKSYAVPLLALAFMVAGVTNANAQAPTPQSIDDPPPLEPHPTFTGVWRWHKPGFNFKDYDKLLVDPPSFFIHDESEEKGIKPEQHVVYVRRKVSSACDDSPRLHVSCGCGTEGHRDTL